MTYRELKYSLNKLSDQELGQDAKIADLHDGTTYYLELFFVPTKNENEEMSICFDSCSQSNQNI